MNVFQIRHSLCISICISWDLNVIELYKRKLVLMHTLNLNFIIVMIVWTHDIEKGIGNEDSTRIVPPIAK